MFPGIDDISDQPAKLLKTYYAKVERSWVKSSGKNTSTSKSSGKEPARDLFIYGSSLTEIVSMYAVAIQEVFIGDPLILPKLIGNAIKYSDDAPIN